MAHIAQPSPLPYGALVGCARRRCCARCDASAAAERFAPSRPGATAFTLIELLVVVAIISLLASMLLPSLAKAKDLAREAYCLSNLHGLGRAAGIYHAESKGYYWPYALPNHPSPGRKTYFWGSDADPVDPFASPFMHAAGTLDLLQCPNLPWGDYVPQGSYVSEPTTTYAYNGRYLDPGLNGTRCRASSTVPQPAQLFVLADAAMKWKPGGAWLTQNSTYLEPVTGNWVQTPTNHFRHDGRTQALCADGHAASYDSEGWSVNPETLLGFVGTSNDPHYEQ